MSKRTYVYFQPNKLDLKDHVGDCQLRALCKALNMEWKEVFDLISPICRRFQIMDIFSCDLNKTKEAMKELGFEYTGISNKRGSKRPTVESFAKSHKTGTYIVTVSHHVVAVVDGKYYDTWDSGYKSLYGYYELNERPKAPEAPEAGEGMEYRIRAYFDEVYTPRAYKRKVVSTLEEAKALLEEAKAYYSHYKYLNKVVIESRKVTSWI